MLAVIDKIIAADERLTVTTAANAVGIAPSTLYRWLNVNPMKADIIQIAALADYLHELGYEDFATLWRRIEADIPE
jgi:hypothetical protein